MNRELNMNLKPLGVIFICGLILITIESLIFHEYNLASVSLAGIITVSTWFYVQYRDNKKIEWEAIQAYYKDIDNDTLVKARRTAKNLLKCKEIDLSIEDEKTRDETVSLVLNSWEKWGNLVKIGYLPLSIFYGSSGDGIADMLCISCKYIINRRTIKFQNRKYACSVVWLVKQIRDNNYLDHWDKDSLEKLDDCLSKLL